ncbi:hypothetical protein FHU13_003773 [Methylobacterium sp. R2-1]|nr:hypothetical protein [Methylobacterium sp. R2-1]
MAKVFRSWDVDQGWLLPPSLYGFVPPGHMAHFVRDTVREACDLSGASRAILLRVERVMARLTRPAAGG